MERSRAIRCSGGGAVHIDLVEVDDVLVIRIGAGGEVEATGLVVVGPDEDSHGGLDELGAVTILNLGSCKYCKHNFSPDYFFAGPL